MVSQKSVEEQLNRIGFNFHRWLNQAEIRELPHILLPDEEIYECVNGYYEAGFALLIATNVRVLLIDKKPLNYLNVEDLRFDMINELDYSHRMMGAQISISAGNKNLKFRSYNQPRLRKLIGHVQHCMAEIKKKQSQHQEGQNQHLEQINQQLQIFLLAQFQSQMEFNQRLREAQLQGRSDLPQPQVVKPSPELADFLYAQSLLREHERQQDDIQPESSKPAPAVWRPGPPAADAQAADLYEEGRKEIFGNQNRTTEQIIPEPLPVSDAPSAPALDINPLRIAYSKLPMALRNRKFGRPSFHAHSQAASS